MAMTPESLLLHADEDGKGISRRRASKNTARLLRLLHCFSISHPPFCVSFHDAITRVSGGLEVSFLDYKFLGIYLQFLGAGFWVLKLELNELFYAGSWVTKVGSIGFLAAKSGIG